jgi:N6-L-threonylcarbamoyladenine synthase
MKILSIETSCDETAIAILECVSEGEESEATNHVEAMESIAASFTVLSHALISQIDIHREFGGVFPAVAKREHAKNLVPLLGAALEEAEMLHEDTQEFSDDLRTEIGTLLERESDMAEAFIQFITETERPAIDAIAVTYGPGLAPALWVGVNFAQALALAWNMPLVPVNHMEGHFLVGLAKTIENSEQSTSTVDKSQKTELRIESQQLPILGLLISGGHTQLMLMESWLKYRLLGETRDDAVGEAFDKVARMMDLPYPGGPEISRLAEKVREDTSKADRPFSLPRPMIDSPDFNFSFSGLKTSVLYKIKDLTKEGENIVGAFDDEAKEQLAHEFENAVTDVLISKTLRALEETQAQTLVIGGGVSANAHIQREFKKSLEEKMPYVELYLPPTGLTGDNAIMIGIAGFYRFLNQEFAEPGTLVADGNLSLSKSS